MSEKTKCRASHGGLADHEIRMGRLDEALEPLTARQVKFLDPKLIRRLTDSRTNSYSKHNSALLNEALKKS